MSLQKCLCGHTFPLLPELRNHLERSLCEVYNAMSKLNSGFECLTCERNDFSSSVSLFLHLKKFHQDLITALRSEKCLKRKYQEAPDDNTDDEIEIIEVRKKAKIIETIDINDTSDQIDETEESNNDAETVNDNEKNQNSPSEPKLKRKPGRPPKHKANTTSNIDTDQQNLGEFCCAICNGNISSKSALEKHMSTCEVRHPYLIRNKDGFHCRLCPFKFQKEPEMFSHIQEKHSDETSMESSDEKENVEGKLPCHICGLEYKIGIGMKKHLSSCSKYFSHIHFKSNEQFECKICLSEFNRKDKIHGHIKEKHPEAMEADKWTCLNCYAKCRAKNIFQTHSKKCAKFLHLYQKFDDEKICPLCDKELDSRKELYFHLKTHEKQNIVKFQNFKNVFYKHNGTFQCILCDFIDENEQNMIKHVKKEHCELLNEPQFEKCQICKKDIPAAEINGHEKSCLVMDDYISDKKCNICDKEFVTNFQAFEHVKLHHNFDHVKIKQEIKEEKADNQQKMPGKNKIKTEPLSLDPNAITKIEICPLCGKRYLDATNHLITSHAVTPDAAKSLPIQKLDV